MLILSLPYLDPDQIRYYSNKYKSYYALIEYRLDYNRHFDSFPEELLSSRSILTIRDPLEGGKYTADLSGKLAYYRLMIEKYDCLVDLELRNANGHNLKEENLILSYHDNGKIPDCREQENILAVFSEKKYRFAKIVLTINNYADLDNLKAFADKIDNQIILAGTGKLGRLSRLLYRHLNSLGTYIGLTDMLTASDQIDHEEAERFGLKTISSDTMIGGIAGSDQVYHSLGIDYYNQYFKDKEFNSRYLPFKVDNFTDFYKWFRQPYWNSLIYGISITMPWKVEAARLTNSELESINLLIPNKKLTFNTDAIAFHKALEFLRISDSDTVLILGNGGTASTILNILQNHSKIFLWCRNPQAGTEICSRYSCTYADKHSIRDKKFDFLINCTPLGYNNENILDMLNLKIPGKCIDLPYNQNPTPLISTCQDQKIPFVDGKTFWKWQAEKQVEIFDQELRITI